MPLCERLACRYANDSHRRMRRVRAVLLEILEQPLREVRKKTSALSQYEKAVHTGREDRLSRPKYGGSLLRKKPI